MKKLLSLLLCLALLLPVMALAETATTAERQVVDFGDFTISLLEGDLYEVADEKTSNALYAIVYPAYDETAASHENFNIVWSAEDASPVIALYGAETYAQLLMQSYQAQYEAMGIKMTDGQVLSARFEDNTGVFLTFANLDYTGMGYDLLSPVYQMQVYTCDSEEGTYIFTFTATDLEALEALSSYLDYIEFK